MSKIKGISSAFQRPVTRFMLLFAGSVALAVLYGWIYTLLGFDSPKLAILKARNSRWAAKVEVMANRLDGYEQVLEGLEMRDNDIYRSIFAMNAIPQEVLHEGVTDLGRYSWMDGVGQSSELRRTALRLDGLMRRLYIDSKSLDEVSVLSRQAGDMASCIPAIPPIKPVPQYLITSRFGLREDPVYGGGEFHKGFDFSSDQGNPVYATGDGVVEVVDYNPRGYGNQVIIDHGFGYKTRYAHLSMTFVGEGMKISRGDCLGEVGSTGKSTGPHLHYEVLYRDVQVDPANFLDLSITKKDYDALVQKRGRESKALLGRPTRRR